MINNGLFDEKNSLTVYDYKEKLVNWLIFFFCSIYVGLLI